MSYVLLGALLVAASLLGFPRSALAATGADNFQRANGALGSSWTAIADGALTISGDQAVGRSANANSGDLWTASSFGSDQFSQVTTSSTQLSGGQWLGTMVRGQSSGKTGYVGIYNWNSGSPQLMLFKRSNSAWTQLGPTKATSALPAGSTLKLTVTGSSLALSANGTAAVSATDSSLTGGAPGIMTYQAAHAAAWTGGDATAGSGSGGAATSYTIGGTVSGLAGGSLTMQDNGGDPLTVSANGAFTFATALAAGASYAVTVAASPAGQSCAVAGGTGSAGANVTSVAVTCAALPPPPAGTTASDGFQRANGTLGASWADTADGGLTISGDQAVGQDIDGNSGDLWTASSFNSDQFSQVTTSSVQLTGNQWLAAMVRGQASGMSGYVGLYDWNSGSPELMLFKRVNGGWDQLGATFAIAALPAGSVLGLQATGSAVALSVNGTVDITANDASLAGGAPGLMTYESAHAAAWSGGNSAYTVGGTVSGLSSGTVSLQDNGADPVTVSANGAFTFPSQLSAGTAYAVTVAASPAGQACTVAGGSGTVGSASVTSVIVTCTSSTSTTGNATAADNFQRANASTLGANWTATSDGSLAISGDQAVGQSVSGNAGDIWSAGTFTSDQFAQVTLSGTQLSGSQWIGPMVRGQASSGGDNGYVAIYFWNNGSPELMLFLREDGGWDQLGPTVSTSPLAAGAVLGVSAAGTTITVQLNGTTKITATDAALAGGAPGIMTNAAAHAAAWAAGSATPPPTYAVGGTISGLSGTVTLLDNGGDNLPVSASGLFSFPTHLATGASYEVTVGANPAGQTCTVASGSGTVNTAAVTSVNVTCVNGTTYTVGGTVSGLSGTVKLTDNGGDALTVAANGGFTFATPLAAGAAYAVAVSTQPSGQSCTIAGASGTVGSANVTSVAVTCAATGGSGTMTTSYTTTSSTGVASYNYTSSIVNDGATEQIRVLQPSSPRAGVAHNFLIALPVEPGEGTTYGDGIATLAALDAQDQYNLTIVEPAFSIDPWYADSATDPAMQMETFMTSQLVPWIKATFATTGSEQVWLLGFSKSGLGAEDLILKHPSVYTLAAGWDFPADMTSYSQLGTSPQTAYGTNANYLSNYQLSQSFVTARAAPFTTSKRLWLGGYYYFEYGVYSLFAPELDNAKVPYDIEPATQMAHRWDSGWVAGALAALYADSTGLG